MQIRENQQYVSDLARALRANADALAPLAGKRVLITGATGLIGRALADMLLTASDALGAEVRVIAAVRDPDAAKEKLGSHRLLRFVRYDALEPPAFDFASDLIIHAASNATPDAYVSDPVGTLTANVEGVHALLKYAAACGAEKLLYVSSSEVYGRKEQAGAFKEDMYGFVDILSPRASYPMGKRAAETLCVSYQRQHGLPVSIVRPGHIYGPTASVRDGRVSSAFAYAAAKGEPLVLKSAGTQLRSYCYAADCASAILTVLAKGAAGEAYNISNPDSFITIREMAAFLAAAGHVPLETAAATAAEAMAFNPMDNATLDSEKLEQLGWRGAFTAEEGLTHTVEILKALLAG